MSSRTKARASCLAPATASRRLFLGGIAASFAAGAAAADPLFRILVIGDSQAQGLAFGLQKVFRQDRQVRVLDRTKISTGLVSRAGYDWPATARTLATVERPDSAVVMFGANDRPPVRVGGKVNPQLSASFERVYGGRVQEIVTVLRQVGALVIWVGHPNVRDADYADDMMALNHIYEQNARAAGGEWLPVWDMFTGPDGGYAPYGKGPDGETTRLRADDGVHLTNAGYELIARRLRTIIDEWRQSQQARGAVSVTPAPERP